MLSGKTGLIVGIANDRSYAWHIAKSLSEHGATCAFTHLPGEKNERRTRRALESLNLQDSWCFPLEASSDEQIDAAFNARPRPLAAVSRPSTRAGSLPGLES